MNWYVYPLLSPLSALDLLFNICGVNRDNVEWTEEQEASAKKKVLEHSQPLPSEKQGFLWVFSTSKNIKHYIVSRDAMLIIFFVLIDVK